MYCFQGCYDIGLIEAIPMLTVTFSDEFADVPISATPMVLMGQLFRSHESTMHQNPVTQGLLVKIFQPIGLLP